MKKIRIDILLVENGLSESRSKAQRQIMAGEVRVDGNLVYKPSEKFLPEVEIKISQKPRFVSRGGIKLLHAIEHFKIDCNGKICVDIGASTGGFTDCLLQNGAKKVYAIDVGYGQLHLKLRIDKRVVNWERTNIKDVKEFEEPVGIVTADASFISLEKILPVVRQWTFSSDAEIITLVKPQFEVGRIVAARGKGVIRDEEQRQKALDKVIAFAEMTGYKFSGVTRSPIKGPKGNVEYLAYFSLK